MSAAEAKEYGLIDNVLQEPEEDKSNKDKKDEGPKNEAPSNEEK